jgi:hypothetical protein
VYESDSKKNPCSSNDAYILGNLQRYSPAGFDNIQPKGFLHTPRIVARSFSIMICPYVEDVASKSGNSAMCSAFFESSYLVEDFEDTLSSDSKSTAPINTPKILG